MGAVENGFYALQTEREVVRLEPSSLVAPSPHEGPRIAPEPFLLQTARAYLSVTLILVLDGLYLLSSSPSTTRRPSMPTSVVGAPLPVALRMSR